jgi:hypothetical protein
LAGGVSGLKGFLQILTEASCTCKPWDKTLRRQTR